MIKSTLNIIATSILFLSSQDIQAEFEDDSVQLETATYNVQLSDRQYNPDVNNNGKLDSYRRLTAETKLLLKNTAELREMLMVQLADDDPTRLDSELVEEDLSAEKMLHNPTMFQHYIDRIRGMERSFWQRDWSLWVEKLLASQGVEDLITLTRNENLVRPSQDCDTDTRILLPLGGGFGLEVQSTLAPETFFTPSRDLAALKYSTSAGSHMLLVDWSDDRRYTNDIERQYLRAALAESAVQAEDAVLSQFEEDPESLEFLEIPIILRTTIGRLDLATEPSPLVNRDHEVGKGYQLQFLSGPFCADERSWFCTDNYVHRWVENLYVYEYEGATVVLLSAEEGSNSQTDAADLQIIFPED